MSGVNLIIALAVVVAVAIAAILLARTVQTANRINDKAQVIADNGGAINESTGSIAELKKTNELATSILASAKPLQGELQGIVDRAKSIDSLGRSINGLAGSIDNTAGTINNSATTINSSASSIDGSALSINGSAIAINSTAGAINNTADTINSVAKNINGSARAILGLTGATVRVATLIDRDARNINNALDRALTDANAIKSDTGDILTQGAGALDTAACIDNKLPGGIDGSSDCQGKP